MSEAKPIPCPICGRKPKRRKNRTCGGWIGYRYQRTPTVYHYECQYSGNDGLDFVEHYLQTPPSCDEENAMIYWNKMVRAVHTNFEHYIKKKDWSVTND